MHSPFPTKMGVEFITGGAVRQEIVVDSAKSHNFARTLCETVADCPLRFINLVDEQIELFGICLLECNEAVCYGAGAE